MVLSWHRHGSRDIHPPILELRSSMSATSSGRACLQRPRRHLSETHIWPPVGLSGEASGSGKLPNTGPGSVRERRVASSRLRSIAAAASKMH